MVDVGIQVADALDAAHGKGHAKILDFGPAKLTVAPEGKGAPNDGAELMLSRPADPLSSPGMALGTMAYM
ncbi:MAG: hypothetical protein DMF83_28120 [Acidobacteria bacterium]|nr:MAG: hypothetical protein DMF83_28120 [Acidobacteriota bacterium]